MIVGATQDRWLQAAFSSYAVPTILGELNRYFRDLGWSVRVPRHVQELTLKIDGIAERLTSELGRTPTADELARACNVSREDVLEARAAATAHFADSLDRPEPDADDDVREQLVTTEDPGYARAERAGSTPTSTACRSRASFCVRGATTGPRAAKSPKP